MINGLFQYFRHFCCNHLATMHSVIDRETDRQTDKPAVARIDVNFHVDVDRVAYVDVFRVVGRELRRFSVFLNPPDWSGQVARKMTRVQEIFAQYADFTMQQRT